LDADKRRKGMISIAWNQRSSVLISVPFKVCLN
jgi:hypothetical protein